MSRQVVQIAESLYQARETAKTLWPDDYDRVTGEYADVLRAIMAKDGCSALAATTTAIKDAFDAGFTGVTPTFIMAACVEMLEGNRPAIDGTTLYEQEMWDAD